MFLMNNIFFVCVGFSGICCCRCPEECIRAGVETLKKRLKRKNAVISEKKEHHNTAGCGNMQEHTHTALCIVQKYYLIILPSSTIIQFLIW